MCQDGLEVSESNKMLIQLINQLEQRTVIMFISDIYMLVSITIIYVWKLEYCMFLMW